MGFLDNLLGRNPTRHWRAAANLDLTLDLDEESFCGVRLGERADRLQRLGPAADAGAARIGEYRYPDRGFTCREEQGRFVEVELAYLIEAPEPNFPGAIRRRGRAATFTDETTEQQLIEHMGRPDERRDQEPEPDLPPQGTLTWHLSRTDCVAELLDGRLGSLWLGTKQ
jgi:hypothetical protein